MSLNLTLAFDRYGFDGPILCYERHRLDYQNDDWFDQIKAEALPLPDGVRWYDDDGLETATEDCYCESLTFMSAGVIARHLSTRALHGFDAAVLAYVKALPPETRVVLWWH